MVRDRWKDGAKVGGEKESTTWMEERQNRKINNYIDERKRQNQILAQART